MSIDATLSTEEEKFFNKCQSLITNFDYEYNPRDHIQLMRMDMNKGDPDTNPNSKYFTINHTTTNDL